VVKIIWLINTLTDLLCLPSGTRYCFRSISLFISFFLCFLVCFFDSKITKKRLDQFAWNFQGRCGVTMGRPDYTLGQLRETARCRDANFFVSICQHYQQSALLAVLCCHLATKNVMNLATSQNGGGVCCAFAPQLVNWLIDWLIDSLIDWLSIDCWMTAYTVISVLPSCVT